MSGNCNTISAVAIAHGLGLKKKSKKTWRGGCPVHGGSSFEITDKDGKALFHCFSGCESREVITALQDRRLWPRGAQKARTGPPEADLNHAQMVCLIAASDIDKAKPISDKDRTAMIKAAAMVRDNPRRTFAGIMARRCLPAIQTWEAVENA